MRRGALAAAAACAAALAGCGGPAGDLLAIETSAGPRGGSERLVIADDGRARCDGGDLRPIPGDDLIEARELAREIGELAEDARAFEGGAPGGRRYVARVRAGSVRWSEGAPGLPPALPRLELFALRLGRTFCR